MSTANKIYIALKDLTDRFEDLKDKVDVLQAGLDSQRIEVASKLDDISVDVKAVKASPTPKNDPQDVPK